MALFVQSVPLPCVRPLLGYCLMVFGFFYYLFFLLLMLIFLHGKHLDWSSCWPFLSCGACKTNCFYAFQCKVGFQSCRACRKQYLMLCIAKISYIIVGYPVTLCSLLLLLIILSLIIIIITIIVIIIIIIIIIGTNNKNFIKLFSN